MRFGSPNTGLSEAKIACPWSRNFILLVLTGLVGVGGCATRRGGPSTLRVVKPLQVSRPLSPQAPHGTLWIRTVRDRRPGFELGSLDYISSSYESNGLYDVPLGTLVGDAILDAATSTGLFRGAANLNSARYVLDVEILHLYARLDRNLLSLVPVIPNIEVKARIELRLHLTDLDGRTFLSQRLDRQASRRAAGITATDGFSRDLLRMLLRQILMEWVPAADEAIPQFWQRVGRSPADQGAIKQ